MIEANKAAIDAAGQTNWEDRYAQSQKGWEDKYAQSQSQYAQLAEQLKQLQANYPIGKNEDTVGVETGDPKGTEGGPRNPRNPGNPTPTPTPTLTPTPTPTTTG